MEMAHFDAGGPNTTEMWGLLGQGTVDDAWI